MFNRNSFPRKEVEFLCKKIHKRKSTNHISKLLRKILDSLKLVYEIGKVLKSIIELFH